MQKEQKMIPWHYQSVQDVLDAHDSGAGGLGEEDVVDRQKKNGLNELPKPKKRGLVHIFLSQFSGPLMIILIIAAAVSGLLSEWLDLSVIAAAILLNVFLGFFEEYKADKSLETLKSFLPRRARVRREDVVMTIDAKDIVPGDIVMLSRGDKVTADGRVISAAGCEVNEAALTGESMPVKKISDAIDIGSQTADQINMVFAGTVVISGEAEVLVTAIGSRTEIGRISGLVQSVKDEQTPLQHKLARFARWLGLSVTVLTSIVVVIGIVKGHEVVEMLEIGVALAVAAIPEGLAVGVTVILAIGMQRILKQDALVRRLVASETLGSVSVICMDKTGTITTGIMEVTEFNWDGNPQGVKSEGVQAQKILETLWYTNAAIIEQTEDREEVVAGSPTEIAIFKATRSFEASFDTSAEILHAVSFDSKRKFSARLRAKKEGMIIYAMGAPEVMLRRADITNAEQRSIQTYVEEMTGRGLRVILVGSVPFDGSAEDFNEADVVDLHLHGGIGMKDPTRREAKSAIEEARGAGLRPVMITGDHPKTAISIAKEVGLASSEDRMVTGEELDEMSDEELYNRIKSIDIYARVMPAHKLRIVLAWQKHGESVAMTGDGVNDAPAIKAADIGIAFGSGTEVAKETADMVLLNNNFNVIVKAIREGRIIFDNVRKIIVYLLADSFSEIILIAGALVMGLPLPILPAQILWINLITDGFPSAALTFEPGEKSIMKEKPRKKDEPLLNKEMKIMIFIVGIVTDILLFAVFVYLLGIELDIDRIRTFIFIALGLDSLIYVFAVRKFRSSVFKSNPFENKYLVAGVGIGIVLQFMPILIVPLRDLFNFTSLSMEEWMGVAGIVVLNLILIEIVKSFFYKKIIKRRDFVSAE
jgi:P-type Ca2+ transporter type 2C